MSERFSRQRGLVRQETVSQLRVSLQFDGFPAPFVEAMRTLGEQLGAPELVDQASPTSNDGFQIEWVPTAKQEPRSNCLHVSYGAKGIFLDGSSAGEAIDAVYEPAIATVAACLIWSEILRRSEAYQPVEIPKISIGERPSEREFASKLRSNAQVLTRRPLGASERTRGRRRDHAQACAFAT